MPYVEVVRKRGAEDLLPQWDILAGMLKSAVASGVNQILKPVGILRVHRVHAYGSVKDGCPDAPDLFVNIDFTTGGDLTPTPEQNEKLREWVQEVLEKSKWLIGVKVAVFVRPFFGASFGMAEL